MKNLDCYNFGLTDDLNNLNKYKLSAKLENLLNDLISKIDTSDIVFEFNVGDILLRAKEKGFKIKKYTTGSHKDTICTIRKNYDSEENSISLHIWDIEDKIVKIRWNLIINLETSEVIFHPDFFRGGNDGLLEQLGIVNKSPKSFKLLEKIIPGNSVSLLVTKEGEKTLFLFSEIEEMFNNIKTQYDSVVNKSATS